ncbi:hypothetical protein [Nonomuraea sp. NPDC049695]|uniref:hypothetical protein n=1 Tax=Nonomuraea sp. NPDC049695 TaxID=3154734 RepID=UPI0034212F99
MRPTIVLLGSSDTMAIIAARLKSYGTYEEMDIWDRLSADGCIYGIDVSGDVFDEYDEGELEGLHIEDMNAILIEYQSASCIRNLLLTILAGQRGFLDTNYGRIIGFDEVCDRYNREPSWDWRRES